MVDQNLLAVFIAVTAVATLIQTGILVGLYFASNKVSRQAERVIDLAHGHLGMADQAVHNLQSVTDSIADYSAKARTPLERFDRWWHAA